MGRKERRNNIEEKKKITKTKKPKQISIFTVLFIIILIAALVGIYFGVRHVVITLKYKEYTDKMITYGFNELYDNKKATSTQEVTNGELLKVVLGSMKNNKDIYELYYLANTNSKEIDNWYEYSNYLGVNNYITKSNLNEKAKLIDAVMFAVKSLENVVGVELQPATLDMSESKLNKFTKEQQELIAKAVTLGVISNKNSSLSNDNIIKGELNKLIISIVEEYEIIYYGSISINENKDIQKQNVSIVTDKENMPKNYKEYPYIVDNIDKEVYEYDYKIITELKFRTPKEVYKTMGSLYRQTSDLMVRYFNKILNVDYTTITTENFLNSILNDTAYLLHEEDVKQYVDYVKTNKIKLQGSATPLLPIMYNNGEQYVVRTKIDFKVLNSDTEYNLLFGDENSNVKYNSKEITMYVDVPLGMTLNAKSLLIYVTTLAENMSNKNNIVVVEK